MLKNRFLSKNKWNEAKIGVNMEQHDIFLAIWVIGNINKWMVEVSDTSKKNARTRAQGGSKNQNIF